MWLAWGVTCWWRGWRGFSELNERNPVIRIVKVLLNEGWEGKALNWGLKRVCWFWLIISIRVMYVFGMVGLTCNHCEYEWDYSGEKRAGLQTSCPTCGYRVRIIEAEQ